MDKLAVAIDKINALNVIGTHGKRMEFTLENRMS